MKISPPPFLNEVKSAFLLKLHSSIHAVVTCGYNYVELLGQRNEGMHHVLLLLHNQDKIKEALQNTTCMHL